MTTRNLSTVEHHFLMCNGATCMRNGGEEVTQAIRDEIARHGADERIHTTRTRCNGRCDDACVAIVYPEGHWFRHTTPESGREMVRAYLEGYIPSSPCLSHHFYDGRFTQVAPPFD
ncbi:(2Fe-2S) ferredoxin domain-containing protein [Alicyclobacillus fastidiosus]|uniref:(2Fe-2S) ferredoxin domain-containing protein n=2 Tax=Alicyclobacillus fastidiosus TaxID=392011 RepID=A0ABY6ZKS6_9BACL|nr:(2Fe-2S) ferredoxin domain-containing protein [Alicyclobacillus fastidiosus]WAH43471.1 (2Fe-2S) ferredoxin domain-containing protein [Alicyclobacillus fastidiosus]